MLSMTTQDFLEKPPSLIFYLSEHAPTY
jgi:hypothetical protein